MKELKDFLEELDKLSSIYESINYDDAKRLISEAYIAGMNFQASQVKRQS